MTATPIAVFVHGLWMPGGASRWFRGRLEAKFGLETRLFAYHTTTEPLADVVERLHATISQTERSRVHLIGHSLGGRVILRLFDRFPDQPQGRVVLLGAPVRGSAVARRLSRADLGRRVLGVIANHELVPELQQQWTHPRELGVIAGTRPMGLGRMVLRFQEPCDGTVAVRETELPGATDRILLPVSHFGMLMSARVAEQTGRFLRDGRFSLA